MALPRRLVRVFLSTPSARRATARATSTQHPQVHFYPRPPRGGRRLDAVVDLRPCEFLSTPSARRATRAVIETAQALKNFYPRPPRGGRHTKTAPKKGATRISIHALREEGDGILPDLKGTTSEFLSTPSARRATGPVPYDGLNIAISIHALREEGDVFCTGSTLPLPNFYPRPPRGGRHQRTGG